MVGLIWLIQLVHYPLFIYVGSKDFSLFHKKHKIFITPVVAIVMIAELMTSGIIFLQFQSKIPNWILIIGLILLGIIWVSTLLIQIPLHNKLNSKFDENLIIMLVKTNWIRTICWSIRGVLSLITLGILMINSNL
tara:strand:+ start:166 stop:570 length:405 start_codon:yes stop_codon:yes gene_type:complete